MIRLIPFIYGFTHMNVYNIFLHIWTNKKKVKDLGVCRSHQRISKAGRDLSKKKKKKRDMKLRWPPAEVLWVKQKKKVVSRTQEKEDKMKKEEKKMKM